jgi:hypothetical protein
MNRRQKVTASGTGGVIAAFVALACTDRTTTNPVSRAEPGYVQAAFNRPAAGGNHITPDAINDSVAAFEPGYGGSYFDNGKLVIWAKDASRTEHIRDHIVRLARVVGDRQADAISAMDIVVRPAEYSVHDLSVWRDELQSHSRAWNTNDVDERTNRIHFSSATPDGINSLRATARNLGIPDSALITEVLRLTGLASLGGKVRPAGSGVSIQAPGGAGLGAICTITFVDTNNLASPTSNKAVVTAGHCNYANLQGYEYYQGNLPIGDSLGYGQNNSRGRKWSGSKNGLTCPSLQLCTFADVEQVTVSATNYSNMLYPWKLVMTTDSTQYYSGGAAGTTVDTTKNRLLYAETTYGSFHVGDRVDKMGQSSGHTYGPVTQTCVNIIPPFDSGRVMVCQMFANLYAVEGDSGGTVFDTSSGGITVLDGMVVGVTADINGNLNGIYFSSIDGVHWDVGPLAACSGCSNY